MCFAQPVTSVTPSDSEDNHAGKEQYEPQNKLCCLILAASLTPANHGASQYEQANAYHDAYQFLNSFLNWIAGVITRPSVTDWIIALSAAIYAFFAYRQWQTIRQQAKIAQQTLVLTQRPKLIARNIVIEQPDMNILDVAQDLTPGLYFIWRLVIANIGGTPATITAAGSWIYALEGELPMERPYDRHPVRNAPVVPNKLAAGEPGVLKIGLAIEHVIGLHDILSKTPPQTYLYVMGWVAYADDFGTTRHTAFCRRWDWEKRWFFAVDNPDYEYAD
jgi:hypothetical protein